MPYNSKVVISNHSVNLMVSHMTHYEPLTPNSRGPSVAPDCPDRAEAWLRSLPSVLSVRVLPKNIHTRGHRWWSDPRWCMPTLEGCMRWRSWPCCWWWSAEPSSSLDGGLLLHGGNSSESRGWKHHRWWWRAALWCTQTWPRRCGSAQRWLWIQTPEPPWRSRQRQPWGAGESDPSWCGRSWDGPPPGSSPDRYKQWGEVVPPGSRRTENCSTSGQSRCATGGSCTAQTGQKPRRPSPWRWGWAWRRRWGWRGSPLCVSGAAPREQQRMQDTRPESREHWEMPRLWCPLPCLRSVQTRPLKARWSWRSDSESEETRGGTFLTSSDTLIYPRGISDNLKMKQGYIRYTWSNSKVVSKMSQVLFTF